MILPDKTLSQPAFTRRTVRRKLALFGEKDGALTVKALHFVPDGDSLVCGQGAVEEGDLPANTEGLLTSEGHVKKLFFRTSEGLMDADGNEYPLPEPPVAALGYRSLDGEEQFFAVGRGGVYPLQGTSETPDGEPSGTDGIAPLENSAGGTCGSVFYERLFVADGCRIAWSAPLAPEDWTASEQGAGILELPAEGGEIFAMLPLGERLYLFRVRGITRLDARGDTLSFRAENLPYACGTLIPETVRACGEKIVFCTESGIWAFDGSACTRLGECGFSEADFGQPVRTVSDSEEYYAALTLKSGERCLWQVLPAQKSGAFLRFAADDVGSNGGLYFFMEGKLFHLVGRGLPLRGRRECTLSTERSLLGLSASRKFLDGVTVEGTGSFRVEARGEKGPFRGVSGEAGERLRFPVPPQGTAFELRIRTFSERARIRSLVLELREEASAW